MAPFTLEHIAALDRVKELEDKKRQEQAQSAEQSGADQETTTPPEEAKFKDLSPQEQEQKINETLNTSMELQNALGEISKEKFGEAEVIKKASIRDKWRIARGGHDEKEIQQAGTWERVKMLFGKGANADKFRLLGDLGEYFGSAKREKYVLDAAEKHAEQKLDKLEQGPGADLIDSKEKLSMHIKNYQKDIDLIKTTDLDPAKIAEFETKFKEQTEEIKAQIQSKTESLNQQKNQYKQFAETETKIDQQLEQYTQMYDSIKIKSDDLKSKVNKFESTFEKIHDPELKNEIEKELETTKKEFKEIQEKENQLLKRLEHVNKSKNDLTAFNARLNNIGKTQEEINAESATGEQPAAAPNLENVSAAEEEEEEEDDDDDAPAEPSAKEHVEAVNRNTQENSSEQLPENQTETETTNEAEQETDDEKLRNTKKTAEKWVEELFNENDKTERIPVSEEILVESYFKKDEDGDYDKNAEFTGEEALDKLFKYYTKKGLSDALPVARNKVLEVIEKEKEN